MAARRRQRARLGHQHAARLLPARPLGRPAGRGGAAGRVRPGLAGRARMSGPAGRVILVGGGPGADDLITVRGLDRLLAADVVISDRLAPTGLLGRLGPDVEIIDAARAPGRPTLSYDEIISIMIDRARAG